MFILKRIKTIDVTIKFNIERLKELEYRLENVSSCNFAEKVQNNNHFDFVDLLCKIDELKYNILSMIEEQENLINKCLKIIHKLENVNEQTILILRFFKYKSIDEIATEMNYSKAYVKKMIKKAIENFNKIYK